jgi:predicted enzyme related to lactoylglutathione lyase
MAAAGIRSKLVICNIPTVDTEAAQKFYGTLLGGGEFAPAPNREESYYRPISPDGIDLTITKRYEELESWTCYFAVDNLERTLEELREAGAEVKLKPTSVAGAGAKGDVGRMAIVLDPDKNSVGLLELTDSGAQKYFGLDERRELRAEQLASQSA